MREGACRHIDPADQRSNNVARPGLAGGWPFDEASGTVANDLKGLSPGAITGATRVAGRFGGALQFAGSSFVRMPDTTALDVTGAQLTLTAWIKPVAGTGGVIIHKGGQFSLLYSSNGLLSYGESTNWCYACFQLRGDARPSRRRHGRY